MQFRQANTFHDFKIKILSNPLGHGCELLGCSVIRILWTHLRSKKSCGHVWQKCSAYTGGFCFHDPPPQSSRFSIYILQTGDSATVTVLVTCTKGRFGFVCSDLFRMFTKNNFRGLVEICLRNCDGRRTMHHCSYLLLFRFLLDDIFNFNFCSNVICDRRFLLSRWFLKGAKLLRILPYLVLDG